MTESEQPRLAEEMEKMEYEPLLPVEKKLIVWSIALGVVLLGALTWVSYTFFPAPNEGTHAPQSTERPPSGPPRGREAGGGGGAGHREEAGAG